MTGPALSYWPGPEVKDGTTLSTTAINVMELRAGVEKLLASRRRKELDAALDRMFNEFLDGRVLKFDLKAAYAAAEWQASRRRHGKTIPTTDAQIAGIAISRRIPIATRDAYDFEGLPIKVISLWDAPA